jgi:hypothetical protein
MPFGSTASLSVSWNRRSACSLNETARDVFDLRGREREQALDFDVVAPGHGAVFPKSAVTETREYFEDLVAAVSAGMAAGQSLEQLEQSVKLTKYRDWKNYERLRTYNVEAAYHNLQLYR